MNLRGAKVSNVSLHAQGACCATYLRKMPRKVLNLELSSGGFSAVAPGVEAREAVVEGAAEFVVEPGRAFSGARSAMFLRLVRALIDILRCLRRFCVRPFKEQAMSS